MVHSRSVLKAVIVVGVAASSVLAAPLPPPGAKEGAAPSPGLSSSSLDGGGSNPPEFSNVSKPGSATINYVEGAARNEANTQVGSPQARRPHQHLRFMGFRPRHRASTESLSGPDEPFESPQRSQRDPTGATDFQKDTSSSDETQPQNKLSTGGDSGFGASPNAGGHGSKTKRGLDIVEDDEEPHAAEVEMIEEDYSHSRDENDETAFAPRLFARTSDTEGDSPDTSSESGSPEPPTSNRFNNAVPGGKSTLIVDRTSVYSRVAGYNLDNGMKVDRTATTSRQATINFVDTLHRTFERPQGPGTNPTQPKPFSSTAVPPLGNLRGSQAVEPVQMNTISSSSQQEGPPKPASVQSVFTSASVSSQPDSSFDGTRTGKVQKSSPPRKTAKRVAVETTEKDGGSGSKSSGSKKNKRGLDIVEDDEEPHAAVSSSFCALLHSCERADNS
ncbi:hypothetical protein C8R42DRAFT_268269 [Lentinula raphanica]|nr:hypothetical protein C8R42DRAFT_268269 [Lentinula raphanica]